MINRADKAALLPVQKIHSLAGIYVIQGSNFKAQKAVSF